MGLRVLITNIELSSRTGTCLYVRDLALELQRQGHSPAVYTLEKGPIANEIAGAGIPLTNNLNQFDFQPEIIHGHHFITTLSALQHFRKVPAIFICHDHVSWADKTPFHPHIHRYFGVSRICVERLLHDGVPGNNVRLFLNFVDTKRFPPRPPLPKHPRRVLVFSNYAQTGTYLPAIIAACREARLELEVVGGGVGNPVDRPEEILGKYDIIFAKGKAAMEAMAVGAAVVLCDYGSLGPMVTTKEFSSLRPQNFGFQALRFPLQPENILRQVARYDPQDATTVRGMIRTQASLEQAARSLSGIYQEVLRELESEPHGPFAAVPSREQLLVRLYVKLTGTWRGVTPVQKKFLKKIPGVRALLVKIKKFFSEQGITD